MKKSILYFLMLSLFFACTNDKKENTSMGVTGKWTLTKMGGNFSTNPNTMITGINMEWQEYYIFNEDGTFIKSRQRNGNTTEVVGTYASTTSNNSISLELVFNSESEIVGTCDGQLKESLFITSGNILKSSWSACDGPLLEYEKEINF